MGCDGWKGEMMWIAMTAADKSIGRLTRPKRPVIAGVEDPVQGLFDAE